MEQYLKYEEWFFQSDYDTRYPEDLRKMISEFSGKYTQEVLEQTKKIQQWIKELSI